MAKDKYSAVWVSHSSIKDFLKCPRAYYLNNIYKDPATGHKIQLVNASMSLGQAVHQIIESLSILPTDKRFSTSLIKKFEDQWKQFSGQKGGFFNDKVEESYKQRGIKMLQRVMNHPGPLNNLAIKIQQDLPYYWLSEEDNIILCGKIDWLEYLPKEDQVHIIDFKTGKKKEDSDSLQLQIYHLLVNNVQHRKAAKASYWYLETDDQPIDQPLPDLDKANDTLLQIAKKIKLARQLELFKCPGGERGCPACKPFEKIIKGEAIKVGQSEYRQDLYVLPEEEKQLDNSIIL